MFRLMVFDAESSVSFNPCLPEGMFQELEAKWALEHYELDASYDVTGQPAIALKIPLKSSC